MKVIKASGNKEAFSSKKIYYSILESGASKQLARDTTKIVKQKIRENITTDQIYKLIITKLKKEPGVAERYNLKRAIMSLGPAGYAFEKYFAEILEAYGYKTKVGIHLKVKKIQHEVDVLAEKKNKYMIECKYHNQTGIHTRLQPALAAYARFLDLKQHKIDQPWLVTNTRCTRDATNYAKGVNLKITSWMPQNSSIRGTPGGDPQKDSLQQLIEKKKLYPITVLFLEESIRQAFLNNRIIMLKTLVEMQTEELFRKTNIPIKDLEKLQERAKKIIS